MNIRTFKKLEGGVYIVSVYTEQWSEGDRLLMEKYGEPTLALGGDFVSAPDYVDYSLPARYAKLMSESPFTQRFDSQDFNDADARADVWKTEIQDRITVLVADLRARTDTFTGEEVVTI